MPLLPRELIGDSRDAVLKYALRAKSSGQAVDGSTVAVSADRDLFRRGDFFQELTCAIENERSSSIDGIQGDFETEALELVFNYNFYRGGSDAAQRRERSHDITRRLKLASRRVGIRGEKCQ